MQKIVKRVCHYFMNHRRGLRPNTCTTFSQTHIAPYSEEAIPVIDSRLKYSARKDESRDKQTSRWQRRSDVVEFRRARHSDYDGVINLDLDGGTLMDCTSDMYHVWVDNPKIYPIVGILVDKPIAFGMNEVLDAGNTILLRGARTDKNHRDLGVLNQLRDELMRPVLMFSPPLKIAAATFASYATGGIKLLRKMGFKERTRKKVRILAYNTDAFNDIFITDEEYEHISSLTEEGVVKLFKNDQVSSQLFPQGRLINDYVPFKAMPENSRYMVNQFNETVVSSRIKWSSKIQVNESCVRSKDSKIYHFVDDVTESERPDILDTHVILSNDVIKHIDMVSCSTHYVYEGNLTYIIDFYNTSDLTRLDWHVRFHLQALRAMKMGSGMFAVSFNNPADEEIITSCLRDHGISQLVQDTEMVLVEKHL